MAESSKADGRESFYAIRRTDGEPVYEDFAWVATAGHDDWSPVDDSDYGESTEFEMVRMVVEPVCRRILPECNETGCAAPAEYWGLCEPHARVDDPSAFESEPSS